MAPNPAPPLEAVNLTAQYVGAPEPALRDLSLRVTPGARVALVGANGAGKSTLLKAAVGLVPVAQGKIALFGAAFQTQRPRVAYLPQVGEIDWRFPVTVQRLVLAGRYVHLGWLRRPTGRDRDLALQTLDRLGIAALAGRQIGQLSGGQRQRALLARTLVQQADLLLLDEPFNAVDTESEAIIVDVLDELQARGTTVVLAIHHLDLEVDAVVYLSEGRQVAEPDAGHSAHVEAPWSS